jgi:hypothetical protein
VAEVVLNRMASPDFGNTLNGVIYAEGQFRSVPYLEDAEPHQAQYEAIERAIYGPYILPEDVAPYIMPFVMILVIYAADLLIYGAYFAIKNAAVRK